MNLSGKVSKTAHDARQGVENIAHRVGDAAYDLKNNAKKKAITIGLTILSFITLVTSPSILLGIGEKVLSPLAAFLCGLGAAIVSTTARIFNGKIKQKERAAKQASAQLQNMPVQQEAPTQQMEEVSPPRTPVPQGRSQEAALLH